MILPILILAHVLHAANVHISHILLYTTLTIQAWNLPPTDHTSHSHDTKVFTPLSVCIFFQFPFTLLFRTCSSKPSGRTYPVLKVLSANFVLFLSILCLSQSSSGISLFPGDEFPAHAIDVVRRDEEIYNDTLVMTAVLCYNHFTCIWVQWWIIAQNNLGSGGGRVPSLDNVCRLITYTETNIEANTD